MAKQYLYTRSETGGFMGRGIGYEFVGAPKDTDVYKLKNLEGVMSYSKVMKESDPPKISLKKKDDEYYLVHTSFRKEKKGAMRNTYISHCLEFDKAEVNNLYKFINDFDFIDDFDDEETIVFEDINTDLYMVSEEEESCLQEDKIIMLLNAIIEAVFTEESDMVFVQLPVDDSEINTEARKIMSKIYRLIPEKFFDEVGFQTMSDGSVVAGQLVYFTSNSYMPKSREVTRIGERYASIDYILNYRDDVFIKVKGDYEDFISSLVKNPDFKAICGRIDDNIIVSDISFPTRLKLYGFGEKYYTEFAEDSDELYKYAIEYNQYYKYLSQEYNNQVSEKILKAYDLVMINGDGTLPLKYFTISDIKTIEQSALGDMLLDSFSKASTINKSVAEDYFSIISESSVLFNKLSENISIYSDDAKEIVIKFLLNQPKDKETMSINIKRAEAVGNIDSYWNFIIEKIMEFYIFENDTSWYAYEKYYDYGKKNINVEYNDLYFQNLSKNYLEKVIIDEIPLYELEDIDIYKMNIIQNSDKYSILKVIYDVFHNKKWNCNDYKQYGLSIQKNDNYNYTIYILENILKQLREKERKWSSRAINLAIVICCSSSDIYDEKRIIEITEDSTLELLEFILAFSKEMDLYYTANYIGEEVKKEFGNYFFEVLMNSILKKDSIDKDIMEDYSAKYNKLMTSYASLGFPQDSLSAIIKERRKEQKKNNKKNKNDKKSVKEDGTEKIDLENNELANDSEVDDIKSNESIDIQIADTEIKTENINNDDKKSNDKSIINNVFGKVSNAFGGIKNKFKKDED